MSKIWMAGVICAGAVSGCANLSSIYRTDYFGGYDLLVSQDAKQRIILRKQRASDQQIAVCMEPSPDALTVFATQASASVDVESKVAATLSGASTETGGSIGLRTQSIQLLRDYGFRICEAYADDALTAVDYSMLLHRYQTLLVAVLSVEQLTGAIAAPPVALGADSSASVSDEIVKLEALIEQKQAQIAAARQTFQTKTAAANTAKTQLDAQTPGSPEYTQAKAAYDAKFGEQVAAAEDLEDKENTLGDLKRRRAAVMSPNTQIGSRMTIGAPSAHADPESVKQVADTVKEIVRTAYGRTYLTEFCYLYFQHPDKFPTYAEAPVACQNVFASIIKASEKTGIESRQELIPYTTYSNTIRQLDPLLLAPPGLN